MDLRTRQGRCEFEIPELAFDIVYPGHYRRRIRSVRLTMPSITGPYTNVSATLRMFDNQVRREPELGDEHLVRVPLPHSTTIATSTAQNDGGVFELNFHDERYMPFEGAGAVSRWQLELPASFRQFDYQTINDVILGIAYTAEEDGVLRQTVEQLAADVEGSILNLLSNEPLGRLFSLRQDFSTAYSRLLHSPPGTPVTIEITDKYFPAFLGGRELDVTSATLVVRPVADATVGGLTLKLDGANQTGFAAGAELGDLPSKDVSSVLSAGIVGEHTIEVVAAGDLAPEAPEPGDDSALDDDKLADILLYVQTMVS
jgi:Tc toxin complex TcA C-terminal TcB-binding domain